MENNTNSSFYGEVKSGINQRTTSGINQRTTSGIDQRTTSGINQRTTSSIDQMTPTIKSNYSDELRKRLETHGKLSSIEIFHSILSVYITIDCVVATNSGQNYKTKLNYDMNSKTFREPYHAMEFLHGLHIDNCPICELYKKYPDLCEEVRDVMIDCYEVCKLNEFGMNNGEEWVNTEDTVSIARKEIDRLLEISRKKVQKQNFENDAKKQRELELTNRLIGKKRTHTK